MTRELTCACCGGEAGKFEQWFNQDTGFGICRRCFDWIEQREQRKPAEFRMDMRRAYGIPGVNYSEEPTC